MNIAAWLAAAVTAVFALLRLLDPTMWVWGVVSAITALAFALMPMLHRFSALAAPLVFLVLGYAYIFFISTLVGTNGGSHLYFLTGAALGIVFLGTERVLLVAAIGILTA